MGTKTKSLLNHRFGRLLVVERLGTREVGQTKQKKVFWKCQCDCGIIVEIGTGHLTSGHTKSCGCLKRDAGRANALDITNQKFGKLTAMQKHRTDGQPLSWECLCDCGNTTYTTASALRCGAVSSCGCKHKLPTGEAAFNVLYRSYQRSAKTRGIRFNLTKDEFRYFTKQHCTYCGVEPSSIKHMKDINGDYVYTGIDRKDNSKGYTVENCTSCCKQCNSAKSTQTYDEFVSWLQRIASWNF